MRGRDLHDIRCLQLEFVMCVRFQFDGWRVLRPWSDQLCGDRPVRSRSDLHLPRWFVLRRQHVLYRSRLRGVRGLDAVSGVWDWTGADENQGHALGQLGTSSLRTAQEEGASFS